LSWSIINFYPAFENKNSFYLWNLKHFQIQGLIFFLYSRRHRIEERKIKRKSHSGNCLYKYSCDMSRCRDNPITSYSASTYFYFFTIYSFLGSKRWLSEACYIFRLYTLNLYNIFDLVFKNFNIINLKTLNCFKNICGNNAILWLIYEWLCILNYI